MTRRSAVIVDCAHYREGVRQHEGSLDVVHAANYAREGDGFVWVGLLHPTEEELRLVAREFDLPELAVEDAGREHQRPKLEEYDGSYFMVLKTARYDEKEERVHFGEIDLFLGTGYAVSARHGEASPLTGARDRLQTEHRELLKMGVAAVGWAVLDQVVDDYEPVANGIEADIEEVEQAIFGTGGDSAERIYFLKREVIEFHRAIAPLLVPLELLERGAYTGIPDELRPFYRDVADHARRVDEQVMAQRELLTSVLEANLALVSVRQNQVVQAISAWAAIIAVPTFFASIWGMNFEHMPELRSPIGYPLALLSMLIATLILHRFFKRIGWL
jgi:magnesium transporter